MESTDIPGLGDQQLNIDQPPSEQVYLNLLESASSYGLGEHWVNEQLDKQGAICGRDGDKIVLIQFTWKARKAVLDLIAEKAKETSEKRQTKGKKSDQKVITPPVETKPVQEAQSATDIDVISSWCNAFTDAAALPHESRDTEAFLQKLDRWLLSNTTEELYKLFKELEARQEELGQHPGYLNLHTALEGELIARETVAAAQQLQQQPQLPEPAFNPDKIFEHYGLVGVESIEEADARLVRAGENIRALQQKLTDCTAILERAFKDYQAVTEYYNPKFKQFGLQNLRRKRDGSFASKNCDLSPFVRMFFRKTGGTKVADRDELTNWLEQQPDEVHKAVGAAYILSYRAPTVIKWANEAGHKLPGTAEIPEDPLGSVTIGGDKAFSLRNLRERLKVTAAATQGDDEDAE